MSTKRPIAAIIRIGTKASNPDRKIRALFELFEACPRIIVLLRFFLGLEFPVRGMGFGFSVFAAPVALTSSAFVASIDFDENPGLYPHRLPQQVKKLFIGKLCG